MNDTALATDCAMYPCAGGCGEPLPAGVKMCPECEDLARYYDAAECERRGGIRRESAHLGAVEREPRRRVWTFLGWNRRGGPADGARLEAESATAPQCGKPAARSELMARLPRVHAGVHAFAVERTHLWSSDVSLATVVVTVAWDAVRTVWWVVTDTSCLLAARHLHLHTRKRLQAFAFCAGALLAAAASWAAWGMR